MVQFLHFYLHVNAGTVTSPNNEIRVLLDSALDQEKLMLHRLIHVTSKKVPTKNGNSHFPSRISDVTQESVST